MAHTLSNIVIYDCDPTGLAALSAAVIATGLSGHKIVLCPVGRELAMLSYLE